jgi:hypothetical protein
MDLCTADRAGWASSVMKMCARGLRFYCKIDIDRKVAA